MKTVEVLIAARALITNEAAYDMGRNTNRNLPDGVTLSGRTAGSIFRKGDGEDTYKLAEAKCFCSAGAITAAVGADCESNTTGLQRERFVASFYEGLGTTPPSNEQRRAHERAMNYLRAAIVSVAGREMEVYQFNDSYQFKHEDVLAAFDLAIKNAKRRHING
jgi:hypothetical protein